MRQRGRRFAMALALKPSLLLADEPVTALGRHRPSARSSTLLRELQQRLRLSMVLVTHDISVVAYLCDDVVRDVMAGPGDRERPGARTCWARPASSLQRWGLRNAFPRPDVGRGLELVPIRRQARPTSAIRRPAAASRRACPLRPGGRLHGTQRGVGSPAAPKQAHDSALPAPTARLIFLRKSRIGSRKHGCRSSELTRRP